MRIATTTLFDRPIGQMTQLSARADTLQTQIATGQRFSTPSQDAAGYRRLESLKRADTDQAADTANVKLAQGLLAQSDSTLSAIESQLQRASELALSAANGTMTDADRSGIAAELDAIVDSLFALANTKDTRGQPLFGGATGDTAYVRGEDGAVSFAGTGTPGAIPIGGGDGIHATVSGETVFGGIETPSGARDAFAIIAALAAAVRAGGEGVQAAAGEAIDGLNAASELVGSKRASVGARSIRLDLVLDRFDAATLARADERGTVAEVDMTTAIAELQKTLTILQATQASFTKLSGLTLFDYLR